MKVILSILLFILGVFVVLAIGGGLLVLMAYGMGWLLNQFMGLDSFQATLITLLGIFIFGLLAERIWAAILATPPFRSDGEEEDDEYDEEDENEGEEDDIFVNPRIPRWRQPLKNVDFSNVKPDERCPCGSGRKYKNCHGAKQPK